MFIGPQRPVMAISGVYDIHYVDYQGKRIFLLSDATHGNTRCDDVRYHPRVPVELYLYDLSTRMNADLFIEGRWGKNIWYQQPTSSHMERVNQLFHQPHVNMFAVHPIDERFTDDRTPDTLVQWLMAQFPAHSGVQPLFDIASSRDSSVYKQVMDPAIAYLIHKYKFHEPTVQEAVLEQTYQDIASFYEKHKKDLHRDQRVMVNNIPPVLYEFMTIFFMFLVDLTFFIHLSLAKTSVVFVYLGSQHIHNIIQSFRAMDVEATHVVGPLEGPHDGCLPIDRVNAMLHRQFQGRTRSKKNKRKRMARKTRKTRRHK